MVALETRTDGSKGIGIITVDDPRIPEDIKELATNYMDNLLKTDDDNDKPGAATQFFQSLAGPIV